MATSRYFRQARNRKLIATLNHIKDAKIHYGASETEEHQLSFNKAYNSKKQVEEFGERTKDDVRELAKEEERSAKAEFREACRNCEFQSTCGNKRVKEDIFTELFDNPKTRQRFRDRIKTTPFKSGELTAYCATLCRPGRLKPTKDYIK